MNNNHVNIIIIMIQISGAAFANSLIGGLSTSVAVFCHELPHELGKNNVKIKRLSEIIGVWKHPSPCNVTTS